MFPKENFSVKITDKRLLSPKRGTIKRSANGNNYNLRKTDSIIKIDVLPPVSFKEMVLGFVVLLLAKNSVFGALPLLILFCAVFYFQHGQLLSAIRLLKERLERDEGIFKEN